MRSTGEFSGSVVILYFTEPGTLSMFSSGGPKMPFRSLISKYWILGVDWGHLPVRQRIWENGQSTRVKADSSMAGVVPAWKVTELLNDVAEVVKPRLSAEAELANADERAEELAGEGQSELARYEKLRASRCHRTQGRGYHIAGSLTDARSRRCVDLCGTPAWRRHRRPAVRLIEG